MSKAAICVVVPVYKAMATLDRCVESVLAQQVEGGLTCILVDDGSPNERRCALRRLGPRRTAG